MSYCEVRPVLVDNDAEVELEARAVDSDDLGMLVRIVVRSRKRSASGDNAPELIIPLDAWRRFVVELDHQLRIEAGVEADDAED